MKTFHIEAEEGQIAKTVLMPGDPMRAKYIAEHYLTDVICYSQVREMIVTDMREHPFEAETVEFAVEVDEEGNEITADEEYQQKMTDLMIKKAEEASTAAQK